VNKVISPQLHRQKPHVSFLQQKRAIKKPVPDNPSVFKKWSFIQLFQKVKKTDPTYREIAGYLSTNFGTQG